MTTPEPNDLDWRAFLYVSGEMSPDKASAFEESMAEDLHACEAVARAVRLTQGLQRAIPCVRPIVAASPAASRPLRGRWGTVASAAGVLVIAGILLSRGVGESPTERPVTVERDSHVRDAQPDAESLIALWTQTRGDWRTELAEADMLMAEADSDLSVPDWLLTAVRRAQGEQSLQDDPEVWQEN